MRLLVRSILTVSLLWAGGAGAQESLKDIPQGTTWVGHRDTARAGMVVSTRPEASRIGAAVLQQGGNAVDAMVAVHFALAVCYPFAGNVGGGGFLVLRLPGGESRALDFREVAPRAAYATMMLDSSGRYSPQLALESHRSVGVPGSVAGMWEAHRRYGRLPWRRLIQPAIDLARAGVALTAWDVSNGVGDSALIAHIRRACTVEPRWLIGQRRRLGDRVQFIELAQTLERIRDRGRDGFYLGRTATLLVAEMRRGRGLISARDLRDYQPVWRAPLVGRYRGYTLTTMPPPSSGGITLLQTLRMFEPHRRQGRGLLDAEVAQAFIEAERRAFADRARYIGDPDFVVVPTAQLLDSAYLTQRMAGFSPTRATPSSDISAGNVAGVESDETTHYSIADSSGMAVAVTTTLNGAYGCKIVVGGAGFFLNNEMDDFSAKPGVPNLFGLTGGKANAIAPRKRMVSSMTPTLVDSAGQLRWVLGSPGGSRIPSAVLNVLLHLSERGLPLDAAVGAPRLHMQWLPDVVNLERAQTYPEALLTALTAWGYSLQPRGFVGLINAIGRLPDGRLVGVADPRHSDGSATGAD